MEPVLSVPACSTLIFHKRKHSGGSPQRWPCDKAPVSVCSFASSVVQKWKTVNNKREILFLLICSLSEVVASHWDLMKRQLQSFSPPLAFTPNPSTILLRLFSSTLNPGVSIHPFKRPSIHPTGYWLITHPFTLLPCRLSGCIILANITVSLSLSFELS